MIFKEICGYLRKEQHRDGFWSDRPHINAYAALTLLSSGDPADLPAVKRCVMKMGRSLDGVIRPGGLPVWEYSLYGITLGEYYLATREEWVVPEMEKINRWLVKAQHPATGPPGEERHIPGGFGHAPHFVGGQNGYGSFNIVTAQAMIAWDLFARCGLSIDTDRFAAAHTFIAKGTNKIGYVWYADAVGGAGYADMGRTGAWAMAHYLYPLPNEGYKAFALHNARCIGEHPLTFPDTHGCPLLGMAWTALGAADESASFRQLMDYNRWSFSLRNVRTARFTTSPTATTTRRTTRRSAPLGHGGHGTGPGHQGAPPANHRRHAIAVPGAEAGCGDQREGRSGKEAPIARRGGRPRLQSAPVPRDLQKLSRY